MNVLVDTSVWSLALRKKTLTAEEKKIVLELQELIKELRVKVAGPIRQELLSGISDKAKFIILKKHFTGFDDIVINTNDYETAAEISNNCRRKGIQGSHTDFLLCAVSLNNKLNLFTTDRDFYSYRKYCTIKLHQIRDEINEFV